MSVIDTRNTPLFGHGDGKPTNPGRPDPGRTDPQ